MRFRQVSHPNNLLGQVSVVGVSLCCCLGIVAARTLPSLNGVGQSVAILARDELGDLDELCGLAANLVWRIASRMAPKKRARPVPPVRAPDYWRRWGTCRARASDAASRRKVATYSQPGPPFIQPMDAAALKSICVPSLAGWGPNVHGLHACSPWTLSPPQPARE